MDAQARVVLVRQGRFCAEKEIKKSRKHYKVKLKTLADKMDDDFETLNLIPSVYDLHQWIIYEVWQLTDFFKTPENKNDKEEIVKIIEHCRSRYKTLYDNIN